MLGRRRRPRLPPSTRHRRNQSLGRPAIVGRRRSSSHGHACACTQTSAPLPPCLLTWRALSLTSGRLALRVLETESCVCKSQKNMTSAIGHQYNYLIQTNPHSFCDFSFIYQICYDGLDLNRFRAPEHICELRFYRLFEILTFLGNQYDISMILPLLLIPAWALAIAC